MFIIDKINYLCFLIYNQTTSPGFISFLFLLIPHAYSKISISNYPLTFLGESRKIRNLRNKRHNQSKIIRQGQAFYLTIKRLTPGFYRLIGRNRALASFKSIKISRGNYQTDIETLYRFFAHHQIFYCMPFRKKKRRESFLTLHFTITFCCSSIEEEELAMLGFLALYLSSSLQHGDISKSSGDGMQQHFCLLQNGASYPVPKYIVTTGGHTQGLRGCQMSLPIEWSYTPAILQTQEQGFIHRRSNHVGVNSSLVKSVGKVCVERTYNRTSTNECGVSGEEKVINT